MQGVLIFLFILSCFIIFWAMLGYQLSIRILGRIYKNRELVKLSNYFPTVTVMVVAHNEEKVIKAKLDNLLQLEYPKDKIKFLVSSDNSTDRTNEIVREFISKNNSVDIRLFEVKNRKGKTNAQNEAQKEIDTEFLVMTDANSMMASNAVKELISSFSTENIAYVTGRLVITNQDISSVSNAEANYWDGDLLIRDIESRIQTITAGNGAIYACRTKDYYDFNPILCHDSAMPLHYALEGKRAIANHDAIAYEKAGEVFEDEFGRKVRMNRNILKSILPDIRVLNFIKYKWFSYFYFGHRTCRYLLWIAHLILLLSNIFLIKHSIFFLLAFLGQMLIYLTAFIVHICKSKNKYLVLIYYYLLTVLAQWVGVYRIITGKAKPFWEKAESTR